MLKRLSDTWKNLTEMQPQTIAGLRNILFILIIADIFGVYWYLRQKKLAFSLMIVIMIFLTIVLIIERRQNNKMEQEIFGNPLEGELEEIEEEVEEEETEEPAEKEEKKPKKEVKKIKKKESKEPKEETQEDNSGFGMGLPSSEEYNKRMEDAYGTI